MSKLFVKVFLCITLFVYHTDYKIISQNSSKFWLVDIDDGKKVIVSGEGDRFVFTARFLIRSTHQGQTPEGEWPLNIQMFTYFDWKDNPVEETRTEGYLSGKLKYQEQVVEIIKVGMPSVDPQQKGNINYFKSGNDLIMPYPFPVPGKYDYIVWTEDGQAIPFKGQQPWVNSWAKKMKIEFSGSGVNDCNTVSIKVEMIDEEGVSTTDLVIHGNIYKFETEEDMKKWIKTHSQFDYLANPKMIPFK